MSWNKQLLSAYTALNGWDCLYGHKLRHSHRKKLNCTRNHYSDKPKNESFNKEEQWKLRKE
jgi:hypothetical protein